MSRPVLTVAVVGHTNTGKTSLLRTLTRDIGFGEVSDRPATTRHVEGTAVLLAGKKVIELFDTPGLEDSIGLLDRLDEAGGHRAEGLGEIRKFLKSADASGRFAQEAKAIRQVLASDIALYVVDARDRVLGKHRDELEILARCAVPVVPVLNFTADPAAGVATWRDHLSRVNMHAVAEFDTVVVDESSEQRLYEKMRSLLDRHEKVFADLIRDRRDQREALVRSSAELIADLLLDVAAHVVPVAVDQSKEMSTAMEALRKRVCDREQRCVDELLQLHRFRPQDCRPEDLPTVDGQWGLDLFSPQALSQFGIRAGGGAAAGAVVGLMVDAMSGFATLGAATMAGAAIGGLLVGAHGKRLIRRVQGLTELRCDDPTLRLLALRQSALVRALLCRGHAAVEPTKSPSPRRSALPKRPPRLPPALEQARVKPNWSRLESAAGSRIAASDPARRTAQEKLSGLIAGVIERPGDAPIEFP